MALPDILFKGVPRQFTRGYTAEVIRQQAPSRVVIPCVGAYALATTAVEAGVSPDRIEACDISLYTSVIGHMLAGTPFSLRAIGRFEWLNQYMEKEDPDSSDLPGDLALRQVAAVVLAIRQLQYEAKRSSLYRDERVRELTERREVYLEQARRSAEGMKKKLGGLRYKSDDMWNLLDTARTDDSDEEGKGGTLILCNPPRYSGGYDRMYQGIEEAFAWEQPNVRQFDESQYQTLVDYLADGPRCLLYYATPVATADDPADEWGRPWMSAFAARPRSGKTAAINWIVTNKPLGAKKLQRADVEEKVKGPYKLFTEGVIRPDSDLRVVPVSKEVASYYRDLFVHNMGMVNAERYKVILLDGKLVGVMGAHLQNLRASGVLNGICKLTFAFSPRHPDYPRLHKLVLSCVVSSWFWEDEISDIEPMPRAIQTTMLTPHPEVKTARGIFTMRDRVFDKKMGQNKLTYYADLIHRTPKETLGLFLRKWAQVEAGR